MKHVLILLCFLLSFGVMAQNEKLTNESIIEMVKGGFSSPTIINKIRNTRSDFKTGTTDLVNLKKNGVPEAVIDVMINPTAASSGANSGATTLVPTAGGVVVIDKSDGSSSSEGGGLESGIFFIENGETIKLESSPIAAAKSKSFGNTLAHNLSKGLVKKQARLIIKGEHSSTQLKAGKLEFTFVFDKQTQSLNNQTEPKTRGFMSALNRVADAATNYRYGSMGSAASPKDFVLAKTLNERDQKTRELLTAGESAFDYGGGLDPAQLVEFTYQRLKEGTYKVIVSADLPAGEYCFFYANARATQRSTKELNLIAFDFGVK